MKAKIYRDAELLETIKNNATAEERRPLLLTGGAVVSMNPQMGDWEKGDVLIVGSLIVGVGTGLINAAEDDRSIIIDCTGMIVLPANIDFRDKEKTGALSPGNTADLVVLRLESTDIPDNNGRSARLVDMVMTGGSIKVWGGQPLGKDEQSPNGTEQATAAAGHSFVGMWVDDNDFVRQELLPDGRYDEARRDRPSAFQGQYWISGNRVDYLDDLGFWAFGEFKDGVLYHAGYRFTRR
jgi:hypothetical protein